MNQTKLKNILSSNFDFEQWKSILDRMFSKIEYFTKEAPIEASLIKSGGQVGTIRLDDDRSLAIFKFEVADNIIISRNRKGLRDIAAHYVDQSLIHGAWVFYYSKNQADYRLTYIAKQTFFNSNGELVKNETAPKRYTFLLGENEKCTTAASRLHELIEKKEKGPIFLADVTDAFSVERLNKEFFAGYKAQYNRFLGLRNKDNKDDRDYVKKLLGRLVFLQFLQKKGWMGVPANNKDWNDGDKNYLSNLVDKYDGNNRLLSDVLEPLFFETLNEPRENKELNPKLGDNIKIPYLNGGLFDKDRLDRLEIDFPYLFFKELMSFFSMYNFTIDENDPDDAEIGIDPEMLGHIFENLLEDNKDKGAFYTPKEIVQYMSRESIIQYLKTHTEDSLHTAIELLIKNGKVADILQNKPIASNIYNLLKSIKVCDPAIGSGAFPMGILNVLYHCRQLLYGFTQDKNAFSPATIKREIIQDNIYGVDIEQGAVDIARLRFWLALVVDEVEPQPLPNLDYKVVCGNSLLSRFNLDMPFDNVFNEYNKGKNEEDKVSLSRYKQLVADYTNTSDHNKKDKFRKTIEEIKGAFRTELSKKEKENLSKIRGRIRDLEAPMLFGERTKVEKAEIKKLKTQFTKLEGEQADILNNKLYENAFEWRFEFPALLDDEGKFTGFDVVIGNPPYLRIQGIRDTNSAFAEELVKKYKSATGSFDLYAAFAERGLQVINIEGVVNFIMPVKWTNAAFGKGLRNVVTENNSAFKIINFGAYQVFNASTYTSLQWFKPNSAELLYYELDRNLETNQELGQYLNSLNLNNAAKINADKLRSDVWVLTVGETTEILNKLEQHPRRISDIFDRIFCGLQTSMDDVYFLYNCKEEEDVIIGESKYLGRFITIERDLVKPLLKGDDVHRYDNITTNRFVIFPYKLEDDKANLYTEREISTYYPQGYAYLKECEEVLREREKGRFNIDGEWFQYGRKQGILYAEKEKLVAPEISLGGNFAYDVKGKFYSTTKIYGYIKKDDVKESYKFWLALFNSRLFWFYMQNTGYVLRGGYFTFKTNYINPFPVPAYENIEGAEHVIENLVNFLIYLYDKSNTNIFDHTPNQRVRAHIEDILNMVIYELYFKEHMNQNGIDVIADLNSYMFGNNSIPKEIERFYTWYQKSENMVRQKLMLLDTRSSKFLYLIHTNYEQDK